MKEIRVKKTARDQLPHLESDGAVELRYKKMANGPQREASQEPWSGYRFQSENTDVYADQQFCESRHKNSLNASAHLHTKVTKDQRGHSVTGSPSNTTTQSLREKRTKHSVRCCFDFARESEKVFCVPAFLRY